MSKSVTMTGNFNSVMNDEPHMIMDDHHNNGNKKSKCSYNSY